MNRRRVAALLRRKAELQRRHGEMQLEFQRELAEIDDEMADAMTEENDVPTAPRRRGGSTRAPVLPPEREVSPDVRAKALRRLTGARP